MKASISAFVLAALLLGGTPARAQETDQETKKKIMQALEKGVDALLKFTRGSEKALKELSRAIAEKMKRREPPKPLMPVPPQPPPPREEPMRVEPRFVYDPWAAWNSFDKGAWVEQETTSMFGDLPECKSSMKTTITSKNGQEIKGDRSMTGFEMKEQAIAQKPEKGGTAGTVTKCPLCNQAHKTAEPKTDSEEIEVAGRKLKCDVMQTMNYDCKGEMQMTSKIWYSREVPGWMAKSEVEFFGPMKGTSKTVVTAFGTK